MWSLVTEKNHLEQFFPQIHQRIHFPNRKTYFNFLLKKGIDRPETNSKKTIWTTKASGPFGKHWPRTALHSSRVEPRPEGHRPRCSQGPRGRRGRSNTLETKWAKLKDQQSQVYLPVVGFEMWWKVWTTWGRFIVCVSVRFNLNQTSYRNQAL